MSTSAFQAPTSTPTGYTRPYKSREAPGFQSRLAKEMQGARIGTYARVSIRSCVVE